MSDLQERPTFSRRGNHFVSFGQGARNWLFHQDMDSGRQQATGYFAMRNSRNCQANGLDLANELAPVSRPLNSSFRSYCAGSLLIDIANGDKLRDAFIGQVCM